MFNHLKLNTIGLIFSVSFALLGLLGIVNLVVIGSNVSIVGDSWKTYQIDRSDKTKLTASLQAELGYGGVIHHFKNYILRGDAKYLDEAKGKLFETHASINYFYTLGVTDKEAIALKDIKNTFARYQEQLEIAKEAFLQGKTPQQVDTLVYVDDELAVKGLETLNKEQIKANDEQDKSKYRLIVKLRSSMGYDGFIHHFKNAILRSNIDKLNIAEEKLEHSVNFLKEYKKLDLTQAEKIALTDIALTFKQYSEVIKKVRELILNHYSAHEIDQRVKVDDTPALNGLIRLDKEVFQLTQARSKEVYDLLVFLNNLVSWLTILMIAITLALITFSLWLIRQRLIHPITYLIGNMRKIAKGDFSIKVNPISDNNEIGEMANAIEVFRNNSAQRLVVETRMKSVLETALDGIVVTDNKGIITAFNPAAEKLFGYNEGFLKGKNVSILMPEPHKSKHDSYIENRNSGKSRRVVGEVVQQQALRSNGELFPIELSLNEMVIEGELFFTGMIRDITDRVRSEEEIKKMALTDFLTGLSNRHHFDSKIEEAVSISNRTNRSFALLLIDMDKFKPVNDTYGHLVGDALLIEVASRLKKEKRDTDTVARIGGDEFAVILNHLESSESVNVPLKRISQVLSQPYKIEGHDLDVGASIGVSLFPQQSKDVDELFKLADAAMYENKSKSSL